MKHDFGRRLDSLILNRNTIYDSGIQRLAVGLYERFQLFENTSRQLAKIQLPIKVLGLSDTKFSDNVSFNY